MNFAKMRGGCAGGCDFPPLPDVIHSGFMPIYWAE
jgi:hypothetical protein